MTIKRALISVSDKTGIVEFAQNLAALGVELLSTGTHTSCLKIIILLLLKYLNIPVSGNDGWPC